MSYNYTFTPVTVSLTTSTARSTVLSNGLYTLSCDEDCYFKQGSSTVEAASTDYLLYGGTYREMRVGLGSDTYVAGIVASGTATLRVERVG